MLDVIKKLDSGTIRGLIVVTIPLLVVIGSMFGLDEAVFRSQLEQWGEKALLLLSLGGAAFAAYARLLKPSPPLTQTALEATQKAVTTGTLQTTNVVPPASTKQDGFFRPLFGALVLVAALAGMVALPGCTGTRDAYRTAAQSEQRLGDTAYVITEHYAAMVREAADIRDAGAPADVVEAMQQADLAVGPIIRGNPAANQPGLRDLATAYEQARTAQTQTELQAAIDRAVRLLADLTRAVNTARTRQ